jgi:hypothetical protein
MIRVEGVTKEQCLVHRHEVDLTCIWHWLASSITSTRHRIRTDCSWSLVVTLGAIYFNYQQLFVLSARCIDRFHMARCKQRLIPWTALSNLSLYGLCFLWGTDWLFKYLLRSALAPQGYLTTWSRGPPREPHNRLANQNICHLYGTQSFITMSKETSPQPLTLLPDDKRIVFLSGIFRSFKEMRKVK